MVAYIKLIMHCEYFHVYLPYFILYKKKGNEESIL